MGLYVAGYPVGRIVIEKMRTDEAELILGPAAQRLDQHRRVRPGRLDLLVHRAVGPAAGSNRCGETRVPGCGIARLR